MKLLRWGPPGAEKPGALDENGVIRDISGFVDDIAGDTLSDRGLDELRNIDLSSLPVAPSETRIGPCVGAVGEFIGIGLNYADHARELGAPAPAEPIVFSKASSSISGPNDDLVIPRGAEKTDWEAELGVVIGARAQYVPEHDALSHIAGYCIVHDVSERGFQLDGAGQWIKGKSAETFGPIGPVLVTRDEIREPQNLNVWLEVDGTRYQNGNTKDMFFSVADIVSYLSQFMVLRPGDIIATGTPAGIGAGQKPDPVFLQPGQIVRLGVEGLGEQRQRVVAAS
jgi:2-keto-4-pentenoate hydratase/2-oxohepta-3-ene-1,7-dioic acid hydratase in catechol pathway